MDLPSLVFGSEVEELLGIVTVRCIPLKALRGFDMMVGRDLLIRILKMARKNPNGAHINIARESNGVGLKANLPSWKISGLGYFFLGRLFQLLLSALPTK